MPEVHRLSSQKSGCTVSVCRKLDRDDRLDIGDLNSNTNERLAGRGFQLGCALVGKQEKARAQVIRVEWERYKFVGDVMRSIQNSQDTASREPNAVSTARTGMVTTNDEPNDEPR